MCRSIKHAPLLAGFGLFMLIRGPIWLGALMLLMAAIRFGKWWGDPERSLRATIRGDAVRHGLRIPHDQMVWRGLEAVYMKYRRSTEGFPTLAAEYSELMASMWLELQSATNLNDWRRVVHRVAGQWTAPWSDGPSPVDASLDRLKRASRLWREADREAHGV